MCVLENGNVVVNFRTMFLGHAFTDPHNVSALLLFKLEVCIEHPKVELLQECIHIQVHLKITKYGYVQLYITLLK